MAESTTTRKSRAVTPTTANTTDLAYKGDFIHKIWTPLMAVTYMLICLFDFIVGPVFYNVLQYLNPGQHIDMWQAVTLQGGGLFHMAMGAILGVSAFNKKPAE